MKNNHLIKQVLATALFFMSAILLGQSSQPSSEISRFPKQHHFEYFEDYRQAMEAYYANKPKGKGTGYKQWKRSEYMLESRLDNDGKMVNTTARYIAELKKEKLQHDRSTNGDWNYVGATALVQNGICNGGGWGRINCIAFHPTNNDIMWVGSPSGGLWKTITGGNSWTCLTNGLPTLGVSAIIIHPNNPDEILILTGDGDGANTPCIGILKSEDGGIHWAPTSFTFPGFTGCTASARGFDMKRSPIDPNVILVAATCGLFRSLDGGQNWLQVGTIEYNDIEFHPTDPNIIYASTEKNVRRSTNGGFSFNTVTGGGVLPTGSANTSTRVELAISEGAPNNVYALLGGGSGLVGVFQSTNQGVNWSLLTNTPNMMSNVEDGTGTDSQAFYDLSLAVDHNDQNDMILGGVNLWRTTQGGDTGEWEISSYWNTCSFVPFVHADIHEVVYRNGVAFACTDGGLYKSTNDGTSWTDLSTGLRIAQFYSISGTPQNANLFVVGAQDNGGNIIDNGTMNHQLSGDGVSAMINYTNQNDRWCSTQNGMLWHNTIANIWMTDTPVSGGVFVTPYEMDHADPNIIFGGLNHLWRRNLVLGFSVWTNLGGPTQAYRALAQAKSNREIVYAITDENVRKYLNARTAPGVAISLDVTGDLPNGVDQLTDVVVDASNSNHVYLTNGGFSTGMKVFRSTAGGNTWINISGSLPNVPVNTIVFHDNDNSNNPVYIGTDIGIYYRDDEIGDWIPFRNNLPSVVVKDLYINESSNHLVAGTFGRGLWRSDLKSNCPQNILITDSTAEPNSGFFRLQASNSISSNKKYIGGIGTDVLYRAAQQIELQPGFEMSAESIFHTELGGCQN